LSLKNAGRPKSHSGPFQRQQQLHDCESEVHYSKSFSGSGGMESHEDRNYLYEDKQSIVSC
jgi:hypothetical protein